MTVVDNATDLLEWVEFTDSWLGKAREFKRLMTVGCDQANAVEVEFIRWLRVKTPFP